MARGRSWPPTPRAKTAADKLRAGQAIVAGAVDELRARGVTDDEIRRLFEARAGRVGRTGGHRG